MRIAFPVLFLLIILSSCDKKSYKRENPLVDAVENAEFTSFKKNFVDTLCIYNPQWANMANIHHCDSLLLLPNEHNRKLLLKFAERTSNQLKEFDYSLLSSENQIDFHRIENFSSSSYFNINELNEWEWNPAYYHLTEDFANVLHNSSKKLEKRLADLSMKLKKVPAYYVQAKLNLYRPAREHVKIAIETFENSLPFFEKELVDSLNNLNGVPFPVDTFRQRLSNATIAIKDYIGWLRNDILPHLDSNNSTDFRLGKELYDRKFELESQSMFKAKEIYTKAIKEKSKVSELLYNMADSLWPNYFGILKKPEGKPELIKMIVDTIAESGILKNLITDDVDRLLSEMRQVVEDEDLMPEGFFPEEISSISWTKDTNDGSIENLRKLLSEVTEEFYDQRSSGTMIELSEQSTTSDGWSLYLLKKLLEKGLYDDSIEVWVAFYQDFLELLSYPILDYSIQVYGMNEEETTEMLVHEVFLDKNEAKAIWQIIVANPVRINSYFIGYYELLALHDEMKSRLGDDFDMEEFHYQFLSYGNIPIKQIRLQMIK